VASTVEVLTIIAQELSKLDNAVAIEGHTDRLPYSASRQYTNWELSADRANAARRVLQEAGLREEQLAEVRGFASTHLRLPENPLAAQNRRISIVVRRQT
jgi:chemotaxis protein MotB